MEQLEIAMARITALENMLERVNTLGSGSMKMLASITLSVAAASFDFQSIPATYSKLMIDLYARGNTAAIGIDTNYTCNNDHSALYYSINTSIHHSAVFATGELLAGTYGRLGYIAAANAPAGVFDAVHAEIFGYSQTVGGKVLQSNSTIDLGSATGTLYVSQYNSWYRSANVINRLTIAPVTGSFAAGSTARLYGVA